LNLKIFTKNLRHFKDGDNAFSGVSFLGASPRAFEDSVFQNIDVVCELQGVLDVLFDEVGDNPYA